LAVLNGIEIAGCELREIWTCWEEDCGSGEVRKVERNFIVEGNGVKRDDM